MKLFILTLLSSLLMLNLATAQNERMKPGLDIMIAIKGVPKEDSAQIDGLYRIDSKGYLKVPLIKGRIPTHKLTGTQLAKRISHHYEQQKIFRGAVLRVSSHKDKDAINVALEIEKWKREQQRQDALEQKRDYKVVLTSGEINNGPQKFTAGMTVNKLISLAGGRGTFAHRTRFTLIRNEKRYNYDIRKQPKMEFLKLQPGDTVHIPKTFW